MLYTGNEGHDEEYLSLADTFWGGDNSVLDLKVKVLYGEENSESNANSILSQYVKFTQIFKKNWIKYGNTREAILQTLKECKEQNILRDYIKEHESEVITIMMSLYDRDIYMELHDAEKEREVESRFASLVKKLLSAGRNEDLEKATDDVAYRKQLFAEFGIA